MVLEIRGAKMNPKSFKNQGAQNTLGRKFREQIQYSDFFSLQNQKSLEGSQQRITIPYPEPAESSPHPHAPLHNIKIYFNITIPSMHKVPPRFVYYLQVSRVVMSIGVHFSMRAVSSALFNLFF